jgi:hypothetical protein
MLNGLIGILPRSLAVFVIFRVLDWVIFKRRFWLRYYLNKLVKTGNYYKTLADLNRNRFCPNNLCLQFIEEAQEKYSDLVHA